jgi:hypothetical protein
MSDVYEQWNRLQNERGIPAQDREAVSLHGPGYPVKQPHDGALTDTILSRQFSLRPGPACWPAPASTPGQVHLAFPQPADLSYFGISQPGIRTVLPIRLRSVPQPVGRVFDLRPVAQVLGPPVHQSPGFAVANLLALGWLTDEGQHDELVYQPRLVYRISRQAQLPVAVAAHTCGNYLAANRMQSVTASLTDSTRHRPDPATIRDLVQPFVPRNILP